MKQKVFKYPYTGAPQALPQGARFLHAGNQDGAAFMWFQVDPNATREERTFRIVGTGQDVEEEWEHLTTWFDAPFVWHLYEIRTKP